MRGEKKKKKKKVIQINVKKEQEKNAFSRVKHAQSTLCQPKVFYV